MLYVSVFLLKNDPPIPKEGTIISAHCMGFKAGLAETCSQVASVLFYIEAWTRINSFCPLSWMKFPMPEFVISILNQLFGFLSMVCVDSWHSEEEKISISPVSSTNRHKTITYSLLYERLSREWKPRINAFLEISIPTVRRFYRKAWRIVR